MSTRIGAIHVDLGLQTAQFQKGIQGAKKDAQGLGASLKSSLGGIARNFGMGLIGGIGGVTGAVAALRQVAGSVAEIRNEAARAGVTTRVFQEWGAVATKARIPIDSMVDAFKELNIRGDEFAQTAKGSAAEAFARLGLTPAEVKERLKDPAEFMLLLIDRTRQLKDTAAATRIFDELFGGTGAERLVTLLGQSTDEIRATIDEANRLGNVLSDDVISRAAELDAQFNQIVHTVGTNLKGAIVSSVQALQGFIDSFRAFENQQTANLDSELAVIGKQRLDLENKILKLQGQQRLGGMFSRDVTGDIQYLQAERDALGETEAQILRVLEARQSLSAPPAASTGGWTPSPYTPPPPGGGGRDKGAASAEREAEAVRRLIAELQHELALVGATDLERETANALRQAGAAATEEQRAQIVSLVAALHAEEQATRNATEAAAELRSIGREVTGGLISDLLNGKNAADALADALKNVADRLLNIGLDALFSGGLGTGGLLGGSIIPGILHAGGVAGRDGYGHGRSVAPSVFAGAPRYHNGGVAGLRPNEVPAILQRGELVIPNGSTVGSSQVINMPVTINAPGADAAALERVRAEVRDLGRNIPKMIDARTDVRQTRRTRA